MHTGVSVLATELVSSTILFPIKNYSYETKISIDFIDICLKPCSADFFRSMKIFFML